MITSSIPVHRGESLHLCPKRVFALLKYQNVLIKNQADCSAATRRKMVVRITRLSPENTLDASRRSILNKGEKIAKCTNTKRK